MNFDKRKVYSSVNADELKAGDRVIVGDSIAILKEKLQGGIRNVVILKDVKPENFISRFEADKYYSLAYLITEASLEEQMNDSGSPLCDFIINHSDFVIDLLDSVEDNNLLRSHEDYIDNRDISALLSDKPQHEINEYIIDYLKEVL